MGKWKLSLSYLVTPEAPKMLRWTFLEQNQHGTRVAVLRSWDKVIGAAMLDEERRDHVAAKRR